LPPSDITQAIDNILYSGFVVPPAFIDPNGHMNVGYYSVLFDQALVPPGTGPVWLCEHRSYRLQHVHAGIACHLPARGA